ncbi:L-threonine ammonia-lyase [Roseibium hamelinense]|uniref:L-threonine ammonia-lyase n=1 Tax=Roseibium hamelinense TaxID=150831 RepID=A0A562TAD9_9HYPH|nr:threonine/serine dehydratase [Roseibium hamelinense]MTI45301.1 threonine/serine dehydratase [Roseibium hamelinense]TWI90333.1 L-threonine ammonia-lyase [Roseibium hamelinense]
MDTIDRIVPVRSDIEAASARIEGRAIKTPLLRFPVLDEIAGSTVLVKPENLQRTGSFKFRGAFNALSLVPEAERHKGVVACSSGNHAQGVAEAARLLSMPATIVMPADAPAIKLQRTKDFGATVVTYDRETEDRDAIAKGICEKTGGTFVHPFNDPGVIAGQGTVGAEIAAQAAAMGVKPKHVLACTGGGGLSSGIALALMADLPDAVFHTVEPKDFDDYKRSLETGAVQHNERLGGSVCDALLSHQPGEIGFQILKHHAGTGYVVSDEEALRAVAFAFRELKLVVEPGGAAALAAVLHGKIDLPGSPLAIVLTGGNIDPVMLQRALDL